MIRISKLADYAFILLAHMGSSGRESWTASDLAQSTALPLPTVAKILKTLAKTNILVAQRGALGGYRLARHTHAISVSDIVESIDGPIALTCCAGGGKKKDGNGANCTGCAEHNDCTTCRLCPLHDGWKKINATLRKHLSDTSLAQISGLMGEAELETT